MQLTGSLVVRCIQYGIEKDKKKKKKKKKKKDWLVVTVV